MPQSTNTIIEKVGHYTSWSGVLTDVVVGSFPDASFFNELPDQQIREHCQTIAQQTHDDLNLLAKLYEQNNVRVFRPKILNNKPCIKTCGNVKVLNPRPNMSPFDHIFCRDNKIILTWQDINRFEDAESVQHIIDCMSSDIEVVSVRPPNPYDQEYYNKIPLDQLPGNKDVLLDSPSFAPAGKHIFYSSRYVCSQKGVDLMQKHFPTAQFVKLDNPITNHLDAQFRIIREGHVISCHSKNKLIDAVPQFKNWAVYTDDSWRNRQLSIASETPMSSWLDDDEEIALADIGFVHVNPNLVIIQRENNILCKALQKAKVDWIVAPMKYDVYFGMAVSCATAILHRTDECIDYFS